MGEREKTTFGDLNALTSFHHQNAIFFGGKKAIAVKKGKSNKNSNQIITMRLFHNLGKHIFQTKVQARTTLLNEVVYIPKRKFLPLLIS